MRRRGMIWIFALSISIWVFLPISNWSRFTSAAEASHVIWCAPSMVRKRIRATWPKALISSTTDSMLFELGCLCKLKPSGGMIHATGVFGGIFPLSFTKKERLQSDQVSKPALKIPLNVLVMPTNSATREFLGRSNMAWGVAVCKPTPWSITVMRSARAPASRKSWVTNMMGISSFLRRVASVV